MIALVRSPAWNAAPLKSAPASSACSNDSCDWVESVELVAPWKVEATNWLPLKLPPWNLQLLNELCMNRLFEKLPLTTVQPSKRVTAAPSEYACA